MMSANCDLFPAPASAVAVAANLLFDSLTAHTPGIMTHSESQEPLFTAGRIPSLDGLRALSISMVLFAHLSGTRFFPGFVAGRRDLGNIGVRIFFVISGFLITTLLLQETAAKGRISLKLFYLRRSLRIFPCAFVYLAVAALLTWAGWLSLSVKDLLHAATYTVNYEAVRPWHIIHLWSLSVEEQFYLIWPVLLFFLGARRGMRFAAAVLVLAPLTRLGMWYFLPDLRWSIGTAFQTNADALAAGCVLAGIRGWLWARPGYPRFQKSALFLIVPLLGVAAGVLISHESGPLLLVSYAIGQSVINVSIALCIDRCVRHHGDAFGRLLNWRPVVFVGVMSYSLYLWQEPFLNRLGGSLLNCFPVNILLAVLAALGSYYLVEKPCLNLRRGIERRMVKAAISGQHSAISEHPAISGQHSAIRIQRSRGAALADG
jgi:peptidoglycan/LPS O-acetylase OafA/YrhL